MDNVSERLKFVNVKELTKEDAEQTNCEKSEDRSTKRRREPSVVCMIL
jgi:hypothetical protein